MIADQVDGPGTDEDERRDHGDDGGADHNLAPFILGGRGIGGQPVAMKATPIAITRSKPRGSQAPRDAQIALEH
jgi:hypothetical protein